MIWHDMVTTISRKVLKWCVVVFYCCSPGPASRKCTLYVYRGAFYLFIIIIITHYP